MAFSLDNPYLQNNPYMPQQPQQQRQPQGIAPPSPDDESTLEKLASGPLSALGWLGESLDKTFGGRTVRSLLGGQGLSSFAHLIPFSDTLGLTDQGLLSGGGPGLLADKAQVPTGRNLLENAGVLDKGDEGILPFLAGMGVDIATDPGTYLTLGLGPGARALTESGKVAEAAGLLPKAIHGAQGALELGPRQALMKGTLEQVASKAAPEALAAMVEKAGGQGTFDALRASGDPLGTLGRFAGMNFGSGETAMKLAGGIDKVGDTLRYSAPMRTMAGLFSPEVRSTTSRAGQTAAIGTSAAMDEAIPAIRKSLGPHVEAILEGTKGLPDRGATVLNDAFEGIKPLPPEFAHLQPNVDAIKQLVGPDMLDTARNAGIDLAELKDKYIQDYRPRQTVGFGDGTVDGGRAFQTSDAFQKGREDILRDIPGGTNAINQMVTDKDLRAVLDDAKSANPAMAARSVIRDKYFGKAAGGEWMGDAQLQKLQGAEKQLQKALDKDIPDLAKEQVRNKLKEVQTAIEGQQAIVQKSEGLADYLKGLDPGHAEQGVGLFPNHPIEDITTRLERGHRTAAAAGGMYDFLGKNAVAAGRDTVPLTEVMKKAGLTFNVGGEPLESELGKAGTEVMSRGPGQGALQRMANASGKSVEDIAKMHVPAEIADDAANFIKTFAAPEAVGKVLGLYDQLTQTFKKWVTIPWPGFNVRNKMTGVASDFALGVDRTGIVGNHLNAMKLLAGEAVTGLEDIPGFKGLTSEQATQALRRKLWENNLLGGFNQTADILGQSGAEHAAGSVSGLFPGMQPKTLGGSLKEGAAALMPEAGSKMPHPLNAVMTAGQGVSRVVEDSNRIATFIGLLKDGFDETVAAAKSKAMHGDYSKLTEFERKVMKRAAPFYAFTRRVVPQFVGDLMENPGGVTAQFVRAQNELRQQDGFVPDYVSKGAAIPLGSEEGGVRKYLSDAGVLPIENLNDMFRLGRGPLDTLTQTGMSLAGQLNPLVKAPAEIISNRQFYTGRPLDELRPGMGSFGSGLLSQLEMNSPAARAFSTLQKATDERKTLPEVAANLLTGAKVTSVDVDKARDRAAAEEIRKSLNAAGVGKTLPVEYIPTEARALMTDDQKRLMQLYNGVQSRAQARAKEKKASTPVQP